MTKFYIVSNSKSDILVIPGIMATKLTQYYWVAVNQSDLGELNHWGQPPRPLKLPVFPPEATEKEIKDIINHHFGEIVAERSDGDADVGLVALIPDKWNKLVERHGIPDF
jgi:hypothetical protein